MPHRRPPAATARPAPTTPDPQTGRADPFDDLDAQTPTTPRPTAAPTKVLDGSPRPRTPHCSSSSSSRRRARTATVTVVTPPPSAPLREEELTSAPRRPRRTHARERRAHRERGASDGGAGLNLRPHLEALGILDASAHRIDLSRIDGVASSSSSSSSNNNSSSSSEDEAAASTTTITATAVVPAAPFAGIATPPPAYSEVDQFPPTHAAPGGLRVLGPPTPTRLDGPGARRTASEGDMADIYRAPGRGREGLPAPQPQLPPRRAHDDDRRRRSQRQVLAATWPGTGRLHAAGMLPRQQQQHHYRASAPALAIPMRELTGDGTAAAAAAREEVVDVESGHVRGRRAHGRLRPGRLGMLALRSLAVAMLIVLITIVAAVLARRA